MVSLRAPAQTGGKKQDSSFPCDRWESRARWRALTLLRRALEAPKVAPGPKERAQEYPLVRTRSLKATLHSLCYIRVSTDDKGFN